MNSDYLNVDDCVECHKNHNSLEVYPLSEEQIIVVGEDVYTHYIVCPETNNKVFVTYREL